MDTKVKERKTDEPVAKATGTESHYHSKKDRVFVRGIQGQYSLKDELKRLRSMPRVRKAKDLKFVDGPQTYSRHYLEPNDATPAPHTAGRKTGSRRCSTCTSRNTRRAANRRSTATSTRPRSTSWMA